jgi:hypothetical protein
MPDPKSFETCVIHAIASHACLSVSPGPEMFTFRYLSHTGIHVINMELKRIEQGFKDDSDPLKPKRFTMNMTSHSVRKLSNGMICQSSMYKYDVKVCCYH